MPFILKHKQSNLVAACLLQNVYDLTYYGVKFWTNKDEAEVEKTTFLKSAGDRDIENWALTEIDEKQLKLFNVKLNNNPSMQVFLESDRNIVAKPKP